MELIYQVLGCLEPTDAYKVFFISSSRPLDSTITLGVLQLQKLKKENNMYQKKKKNTADQKTCFKSGGGDQAPKPGRIINSLMKNKKCGNIVILIGQKS